MGIAEHERVAQSYRGAAKYYDRLVNAFDVIGLHRLRQQAVEALDLHAGDTVIDIGCGSGLNFELLEEVVGPHGHIIGVDLTDAMLALARQRVEKNGWTNITLVESSADEYLFPPNVDAVLATFSLVLVPDCARVIVNGCEALKPGRRWVVLDMAWPRWLPLWWRHVLVFMRGLGVNKQVLERRNWETIWEVMRANLTEFRRKRYWMGIYYEAVGTKRPD